MTFFSTNFALASIIACAAAADSPREISPSVAAAEARVAEAKRLAEKEFPLWADKLPEGPASLTPAGANTIVSFDANPLVDEAHPGFPAIPLPNGALTEGHRGNALVLNLTPALSLPQIRPIKRTDSVTFAFWFFIPEHRNSEEILQLTSQLSGNALRGFQLGTEKGHLRLSLHHHSVNESAACRSSAPIVTGRWTHLAATYDGSSRAAGIQFYIDGRPSPAQTLADTLDHDILPDDSARCTLGPMSPAAAIDELLVFPRALSPLEITAIAGLDDYTDAVQHIPDLNPAQHEALLNYYIATAHQPSIEARAALREARQRCSQ